MGARQQTASLHSSGPGDGNRFRAFDSYGIVLVLIILDYVAVSALAQRTWGQLCIVVLLGLTLFLTLRTSGAGLVWRVLAVMYLVVSTLLALLDSALPGASVVSPQLPLVGGLLLLVTPFAIARRISSHRVVTSETVLGAICVYLLLGFSFAFMYSAIGAHSPTPFFLNHSHATINEYLFFSYTTLTTVGYGNLVPAGNIGQTFAMLEALMGQIYLVIVVARLVSLWGQERPTPRPRSRSNVAAHAARRGGTPQDEADTAVKTDDEDGNIDSATSASDPISP